MQAPTLILNASQEDHIREAVSLLRSNGVVALPTETVYGLAANAFSTLAVQKIFKAKLRPQNNPLIWHTYNQESARSLFNFSRFNETSKRRFNLLSQAFWPGPLTMVAQKSSIVGLHVNLDTIAVRVPRSEVTRQILRLLDIPLVMPSANISSRPSPTCSNHVLKTLGGRIDAVVDAGVCEVGIESTVVRIDQEDLRILRPGAISATMLEKILGEPAFDTYKSTGVLESPGMAFKHYAPRVDRVILIKPHELETYWHTNSSLVACTSDLVQSERAFKKRSKKALTIALADDPELFAANIYDALYKAEECPHESLVLVLPQKAWDASLDQENVWAAVFDRLRRSAGYKS